MSIQREIRYIEATEVRAMGGSGDADPLRIEGYASVFNRSAKLPGFRERILPGAFTRAIEQKQDVVCLFNHNSDIVLGRTTSGTLRLRQDARGLFYSCDLPNTQSARDIHESIRRGDINGCSFAFNIPDGGQDWSEQRDDDGTYFVQRDISDTNLLDVSPVTYPCYQGTDVYARSAAEVPVELRSAVDAKNAALVTPPAVIVPPVKERKMKTAAEMRQIVDAIDNNIDSFEDAICEVSKALAAKFPAPEAAEGMCQPCYGGQFYEMETYEDFVIACECTTGEYYMIPYLHDESKPEGEEITFGEPVCVEKTWVPSDRNAKKVAEFRAAFPLPTPKPAVETPVAETRHADESDDDYELDLIDWRGDSYDESMQHENHVDGDCMERDCICQNRMCMGGERADSKTRTKRVGGKDLSAKSFAYVGDPDKTETWKLPIHDASHVRNALARFDQTDLPADAKAGAKRKILAAAKRFGIEASEAKSAEPTPEPVFTQADRIAFADRLLKAGV